MKYKTGANVMIPALFTDKLEVAKVIEGFTHWTGFICYRLSCEDGSRTTMSQHQLDKWNDGGWFTVEQA